MTNRHEEELPADVVLVKQIGSLGFFFSKTQHAFFIKTEDYHTGPVKFTKAEIIELLNIYDLQTGEKEKDLLAELDADDDEDFDKTAMKFRAL